MNEIMKFVDEIYALKHIVRYNHIGKILTESVAEHTFFVSAIAMRLHRTYRFDMKTALQMAIIHDFIETHISDIPRDVKDKYKKLDIAIALVEREAWHDIYPEYVKLIEELEEGETPEAMVVKLADILSVAQYSNAEIKLGNTSFQRIKESSEARSKKLLAELERYKR